MPLPTVQRKGAYWPLAALEPTLGGLRREQQVRLLLPLAPGTLHPPTITGAFINARLCLQRVPLVVRRRQHQERADSQRVL